MRPHLEIRSALCRAKRGLEAGRQSVHTQLNDELLDVILVECLIPSQSAGHT
jgi:hypothetical protein